MMEWSVVGSEVRSEGEVGTEPWGIDSRPVGLKGNSFGWAGPQRTGGGRVPANAGHCAFRAEGRKLP